MSDSDALDETERESRQTATYLADHLVDHPEDLTIASLRLQVAVLQEKFQTLSTEVHQRWT